MPEAGLQSSPTEGVIHVASSVDNPAMSPPPITPPDTSQTE